jgi:hypothetical protein
VPDLDDGHHVQDMVDPPIPCAGQTVSQLLTGGGIQRSGAVPCREVGLRREPGDVTDIGQDPGSAGGADPEQAHQL